MKHDRSITVTAMSRPHVFRQMLESLVRNDLDGWSVVIRVEPSERSHEFAPIAAELLAGIDYDLQVNAEVRGITFNPLLTIEEAFADGSGLNLYLEEDLLVSPDATALARWYQREHRPAWLCLNLLAGPCGSAGYLSNREHPDLLFETRTFNSIGFVMRREEWEAHARAAWLSGRPQGRASVHATWRFNWGWDWALYGLLASDTGLRSVQPALARATHNGRDGGTYASPAFHDAAFGKLPLNEQADVAYQLCPMLDLPQDVRAHVFLQDEITTMRMQMEQVALGEEPSSSTTITVERRIRPPAPPQARTGFWQRLRGG
ncbi:MAG: hypothetical protein AB7P33_05830 [Dehalococcoidia bacterium]